MFSHKGGLIVPSEPIPGQPGYAKRNAIAKEGRKKL